MYYLKLCCADVAPIYFLIVIQITDSSSDLFLANIELQTLSLLGHDYIWAADVNAGVVYSCVTFDNISLDSCLFILWRSKQRSRQQILIVTRLH